MFHGCPVGQSLLLVPSSQNVHLVHGQMISYHRVASMVCFLCLAPVTGAEDRVGSQGGLFGRHSPLVEGGQREWGVQETGFKKTIESLWA